MSDSNPNSDKTPPPLLMPAGWYADPQDGGYRWWDGANWGPKFIAQPGIPSPPMASGVLPVSGMTTYLHAPRSSGLALILTIFLPGVGHIYLGLVQKGTPFAIATAVAICLSWTIILIPVSFIIWLICVVLTAPKISEDADFVNRELAAGRTVF